MVRKLTSILFALPLCAASGYAYSDSTLIAAYNQMAKPSIDTMAAVSVANLNIEAHDFKLLLDSGTVYFLAPVVLDSAKKYYGAYFEGQGRFQFRPSLHMERNQLARFMGSDSLNRHFTSVLVFFNDSTYRLIKDRGRAIGVGELQNALTAVGELQDMMTKDEQKSYLFSVLQNLAFPRQRPFLLARVDIEGDDVIFTDDPSVVEEVTLSKHSFRLGFGNSVELICSYSASADDSRASIDGVGEDALVAQHYDFDGAITRDGKLVGFCKVTLKSSGTGNQMEVFELSSDLVPDSIKDSSGSKMDFLKFKKKDHQDGSVYVVLPRTLNSGETIALTFFYHGDIAWKELGMFYVDAGAEWYPRLGYRQRATFDMKFRTPSDYSFVVTGTEQERRKIKDTLYTHYEVTQPAANVSFNIGVMKKYTFGDTTSTPVDVYFSEDLHHQLESFLAAAGEGAGSHMERQVGGDVLSALKLFSHFFGTPSASRFVASEILSTTSDAYPGFVRLGSGTWINTDAWGYDRMLRAHEVAHQWWGVGVGYKSYRDQWLSEGFSEYCSLMYLQAVAGNGQFHDRLEEYRKDVMGAKGTKISDNLEGTPLALGYRASSVTEPEVGQLLLYKKGAYVLHMLRNLLIDLRTMKEDRFLNMMKDYRTIYQDSNATTSDFQRVVEKHVGEKMDWFFDEWVYHSYIPTYDFKYETAGIDSAGCKVMIHVTQKDVPYGFKMYVPLEIQFDDGKAYLRILVDSPQIDLPLELPKAPKKLTLNPFNSVLAKVNQ